MNLNLYDRSTGGLSAKKKSTPFRNQFKAYKYNVQATDADKVVGLMGWAIHRKQIINLDGRLIIYTL